MGRNKNIVEKVEAYCKPRVNKRATSAVLEDLLFMPCSEALLMRPSMISPSKGRKTMTRNSTELRKHEQIKQCSWTDH